MQFAALPSTGAASNGVPAGLGGRVSGSAMQRPGENEQRSSQRDEQEDRAPAPPVSSTPPISGPNIGTATTLIVTQPSIEAARSRS